MDVMKKVPVREQEPAVRAKNFEEVCLGYNAGEAVEEASRCLNCKNAQCVKGCPVSIDIPGFIKEVKEGNFKEAAAVIGKSSSLPAVCGRVCPQESQCEGKCIRGIKGEPVSIGKLERFVADWSRDCLLYTSESPCPSDSWSGLWRTGPGKMGLSRRSRSARTGERWQSSDLVLQALPALGIWRRWDMR